MKLAAKLMLVFFGIVILLTGVSSYFAVWRGLDRLERQQAAYADRLAQSMEQQLQVAWQMGGPDGIIELLRRDEQNWSEVRIRWVWFDPLASELYRPVAPLDQYAVEVTPGTVLDFDVVVRTRGVGHPFTGGTTDSNMAWLEVSLLDAAGAPLLMSGGMGEDQFVDDAAHSYRGIFLDEAGQELIKRKHNQMARV